MGRRDRAIRRETGIMSLLEASVSSFRLLISPVIEKPTQVSTSDAYTAPWWNHAPIFSSPATIFCDECLAPHAHAGDSYLRPVFKVTLPVDPSDARSGTQGLCFFISVPLYLGVTRSGGVWVGLAPLPRHMEEG